MASKNTVLVIGGTGMVGMATAEAISTYLDAEVLTYDRPATTDKQIADRAQRRADFEDIKAKDAALREANKEPLVDTQHEEWLIGTREKKGKVPAEYAAVNSIADALHQNVNCIVIASGVPRKNDQQTRSDLTEMNAPYFRDLGVQLADAFLAEIKKGNTQLPVVINTGNPVDTMTETMGRTLTERLTQDAMQAVKEGNTQLARDIASVVRDLPHKIMGQGGVLDGARAAFAIGDSFNIPKENLVRVPVVGPHSNSMIVDYDSVRVHYHGKEVALKDCPGVELDTDTRASLHAKAAAGGTSVLKDTAAKTGHKQSATFSTGAAVMIMVEAVLELGQGKDTELCASVFNPRSKICMGHKVVLSSEGAKLLDTPSQGRMAQKLEKGTEAAESDIAVVKRMLNGAGFAPARESTRSPS